MKPFRHRCRMVPTDTMLLFWTLAEHGCSFCGACSGSHLAFPTSAVIPATWLLLHEHNTPENRNKHKKENHNSNTSEDNSRTRFMSVCAGRNRVNVSCVLIVLGRALVHTASDGYLVHHTWCHRVFQWCIHTNLPLVLLPRVFQR